MSTQDEAGGGPTSAGRDAAGSVAPGALLRQERERRGMSLSEAARQARLPSDQIEQIENGGTDAFHSQGHKRLATRKYAVALGIALEDEAAHTGEAEPEAPAYNDSPEPDDADASDFRGSRARIAVPAVALLIAAALLAVPYSMLKQLESALSLPTAARVPFPKDTRAFAPASPSLEATRAPDEAGLPAECAQQPDGAAAARRMPGQASRNDRQLDPPSATEVGGCVVNADRRPRSSP